ncbi:MAG: aldose 1-epimerase family protein [Clostridia bacterium]|nr:aldose 1-epimerase family protein [Clostridia bacterium]
MIVTIKNEFLKVDISRKGAELQSVVSENREYLWQADPKFWGKHAPVLFPVVARNLDDQITVGGAVYPMPKHGFAKDNIFEIEEKTESSVTLLLESSEETKKLYPFDFKFRVIYSLSDHTLSQTYKVENTGDIPLYYTVGAHPALTVPGKMVDWTIEFQKDENLSSIDLDENDLIDPDAKFSVPLDNGFLPLSAFKDAYLKKDTLVFERLESKEVTLWDKDKNHGIKMTFTDFPSFAIWTHETRDADYVCLEPWHGMGQRKGETCSLENRFDMITLAPKTSESKTLTMEMF